MRVARLLLRGRPMHTRTTPRSIIFLLAGSLSACGHGKAVDPVDEVEPGDEVEASSKVVVDWSAHTEQALVVDSKNIDPLPATRTITMVHVAMHDAVNAARPEYTT